MQMNWTYKHYQYGFRKGHGCESHLLITVEDIGRQLDQQHQVDILILDFAKTFDTVPHRRLLTKLKYYGVRGRTLNWIQNWIIQRPQTVKVYRKKSRHVPVKSVYHRVPYWGNYFSLSTSVILEITSLHH